MDLGRPPGFVSEVLLKPERAAEGAGRFPFTLAAFRDFRSLRLDPRVTIFVGENGSGKSTLLEAIAVAYGFNAEGGSKNFNFSTKDTHSILGDLITLVKPMRMVARDGYFLRAESYYNVASEIDRMDDDSDLDPRVKPGQAVNASYGGRSLHEQSHGESFLALFLNRLRGNGFYVLDEPEAALSPMRQMTILARMHELVAHNSQFVVATHSPIIMAYPGATIYSISESGPSKVAYTDTEHYQVMRYFLENPEGMLRTLLAERESGE